MKYFLKDTWVNDSTVTKAPTGATVLTDEEWKNRQSEPYVPTAEDIAAQQAVADAEAIAATAKAALLARLGITADEAKLLIG